MTREEIETTVITDQRIGTEDKSGLSPVPDLYNPCTEIPNPQLAYPLAPDGKGGFVVRDPSMIVRILYTNWEGKTAWRRIVPLPEPDRFESSKWHPQTQWVMKAWDLDKGAERSFARADIHQWKTGDWSSEEEKESYTQFIKAAENREQVPDGVEPLKQTSEDTKQGDEGVADHADPRPSDPENPGRDSLPDYPGKGRMRI